MWAEACSRSDILAKKTDMYRLCELHFEERYFSKITNQRKRLHADAVPTIFTRIAPRPLEVHLEEEVPRKIKIVEQKLEEEAPEKIKILSSK